MRIWVLAALLSLFLASCSEEPESFPLLIIGKHKSSCYEVELADNDLLRAKGLMHRESLDKDRGMLFVYDQTKLVHFWMKNVSFPLDIIFISEMGEILKIHENAIPYDVTPISSGAAVKYVLELNAGVAELAEISGGDEISLAFETSNYADCNDALKSVQ